MGLNLNKLYFIEKVAANNFDIVGGKEKQKRNFNNSDHIQST